MLPRIRAGLTDISEGKHEEESRPRLLSPSTSSVLGMGGGESLASEYSVEDVLPKCTAQAIRYLSDMSSARTPS